MSYQSTTGYVDMFEEYIISLVQHDIFKQMSLDDKRIELCNEYAMERRANIRNNTTSCVIDEVFKHNIYSLIHDNRVPRIRKLLLCEIRELFTEYEKQRKERKHIIRYDSDSD